MEVLAFTKEDSNDLLSLMAAFNSERGYSLNPEKCRMLFAQILEYPSLGNVWLVRDSNQIIGYIVACYCFSFKHGGRDAFIDEIYLFPESRRKGFGQKMIWHVANQLPGIQALHLEVEDNNTSAKAFYEQVGFIKTTRRLMTLKSNVDQ